MEFFRYFSKQDCEKIHDATLNVLENTGMVFNHGQALELFKKAGCRTDGKKVFLPGNLVEENIKKATSQFTLHARNPEKNVIIGGDHIDSGCTILGSADDFNIVFQF